MVPRSALFAGLVVHDVGHAHQRASVMRQLSPLSSYGNGLRVHMVLMKWSDECL